MLKQYTLGAPSLFVGRTQERAEIAARLMEPDCRLLTLTGLGGSGKTRLAVEVAHALAPEFPHGAAFVPLQPLTRSDLLVPAIAQALGVTFYGNADPQQQLLNYLQDKTLLLILDNFEHILDGAVLISTLLAATPGLTVLITSREALSLREEWLYPLKGMTTPPSIYSTPLEDYEAVQLFLSHARRVQPHFDLGHDPESVIRICQMTAGLPLAIELAAAWLKGSSAAQIAQEIRRNLDVLSTTTRNVEERHRSMRAVFDQSWKLLAEDERLIFARLSVFSSDFDGSAAQHVAGASFANLAGLVEKSLIHMDSVDRFGMHELLRQYGMVKLEEYRETTNTYARHSQYFAQRMGQHEAALKQPQQLEALRAIERDFDNIRLAWEWSAKHQQAPYIHALINGLYLFGFLRSRYRELIAMFLYALAQPIADTALLARLRVRRWGYLHWLYQDDYQEALANIDQALAIAAAENNQFEMAFCQLMAAFARISMHRYTDALPHLETSLALFEAIDEPYYVCWALHRLGYIYYNLNDHDTANAYTEQSLALARVTHNRAAMVTCLYNLGSDYILNSEYVKGRSYCEEALQIATETGHQGQIAHALSLLSLCAFFQDDYAMCQEYAARSQKITEDIKLLVFQPYNLSLLILLACLREDYAAAVHLNKLGERHIINKMGSQLLYWALAALSCGLGKPAEVRACIEKLLQVSDPEVNSVTTIWIVPSVAYMLAETEPEKAVELLGWVFSHPDLALNWARRWPLSDRLQTRLRELIDDRAYRARWEKGKTLTLDTIKTYLQHEFRASPDAAAEASDQQLLTARESEILRLMATGLTNPQIAAQLVIGAGTVKTHTLNIYRKLEVANRTQAIVRAQELGLLLA
jgi:predicted ATPase/DNA-binding CsgD family transcriptional regulator